MRLLGPVRDPLSPPARFWALLALVLLLGMTRSAPAEPRNWALVIGVDRYRSESLPPLPRAEADARLLARTLRDRLNIPPERLFLFTSDGTGYQAPTRANVAFRFEYLVDHVGPQDTLVFAFFGHGREVAGHGYLLTCEANPASELTLQETALRGPELWGWMHATRARRILLLADPCQQSAEGSDPPMSAAWLADLAPPASDSRSCALLVSAGPGQLGRQWPQEGQGLFALYLARGLEGEAATPEGAVRLPGLASYLLTRLGPASLKLWGRAQVPWFLCGPDPEPWELCRAAWRSPLPGPGGPAGEDSEHRRRQADQAAARLRELQAQATGLSEQVEQAEAAAGEARAQARRNPLDLLLEERARQKEETLRQRQASLAENQAAREQAAREVEQWSRPAPAGAPTVVFVSALPGATCSTLRQALAAVPPGSRILLGPGTYRESLQVDRPVEIVGDGPADQVVLEGQLSASVPVSLRGLTVRARLTPPERFQLSECNPTPP